MSPGRREGMRDVLIAREREELAGRAAEAAHAPPSPAVPPPVQLAPAVAPAIPPVRPLAVPESRRPKDARGRLAASRLSARNEPRAWVNYTVRLPDKLAERLRIREANDKLATRDRGLHRSHYLNAALTQVPADPAAAVRWGVAWRARAENTTRPDQVVVGSRAHRDVRQVMDDLYMQIPVLPDPRPSLWEIQAEAVTRFLDALDAEPATLRQPGPGT